MNIAKAWLCAAGALAVCGTLSGMVVVYGPPSQSPGNLVVQTVFVYAPALLTLGAATMLGYLVARPLIEDQRERMIAGFGLPVLALPAGAVVMIVTDAAGVDVALIAVAAGAAGAVLGGALAEQLYLKRRRTRADWY